MEIGLCSAPSTHAPSHSSCTGHTRAQVAPNKFESRMVRAEPRRFPVEIFLMNFGISMCVGQACVQGASKHIKHRAASTAASLAVSGGKSSSSPTEFPVTRAGSCKSSSASTFASLLPTQQLSSGNDFFQAQFRARVHSNKFLSCESPFRMFEKSGRREQRRSSTASESQYYET